MFTDWKKFYIYKIQSVCMEIPLNRTQLVNEAPWFSPLL